MNTNFILLFFALLIFPLSAISQNCAEKKIQTSKCIKSADKEYTETGKSLSFPLVKGQTQKVVMNLPGKKDYYISICSELSDNLIFKIKNADNPDELIFDNTIFGLPQYVELVMQFTNKIVFEITLPKSDKNDKDTKAVCVGLLVFQKDSKDF